MTYSDFTLRLVVALVAGLLIGIEREWQSKPAGIRTNSLVAVGSSLFVLLSVNLTQGQGDVTRIIGQIVTGVGFLGAGIIFKQGSDIYGLTTAATIWCSAAVGSLAGAGFFVEAGIGVLAVITVNFFLIPFDRWMEKKRKSHENDDSNN